MKKLWTRSGFVSFALALAAILPVSYEAMAQSSEKIAQQNRKREILTKVEKEVNNLRNAEMQKQSENKNSQSTPTKSSVIREIPAKTAVSESDSTILVNFYNATGGPGWTNNTNWLTGPINTWYGVTVENDVVTELKLKQNNLSGTIPPELGQLTSLEFLDLDTNQLTGAIPIELGNLTGLEYLYLNGNQLTGTFPAELLQLTNLVLLYLSDNQLSGIIPEGIGQLSALRWLDLSHNQFSGEIPTAAGQLPLLQFLDLGQNQLTGTIPIVLGQLQNLRWLALSENQLTGSIPAELAALANLEMLYVDNNQLTGTVPPELGQLTNMIWLNLGQNQFSGTVPQEFAQLVNMQLLYLNTNQLTGSIPAELGQITELRWVDLSQNQLTGDIPDEIWQLTNLDLIYLNSNQLTGTLPAQIGQISGLEWIDLSGNQITGAVPDEITLLSNLQILNINSNQFSSLPDMVLHDSLAYVDVSGNLLSFEDLEYNMDLEGSIDFFYAPQDSIGTSETIAKKPGASVSFAAPTGGVQNNYQWYKDDIALTSQTSANLELTNLAYEDSGKYHCVVTNDLVTGLTLTSRIFTLKVDEDAEACQKLVFVEGWQIFSTVAVPDSADMKYLFQPLIDNESLVKIQDEEGKAVEDFGFLGGWLNNIGNINPVKGYKLRMIAEDSLEICGTPVEYPVTISLKAGWNIIGFPQTIAVDAMNIVQNLIDDGSLEKVQDDTGKSIEDFGFLGGWINNIGDFIPGKGYKIKLSSASNIAIQAAYPKSSNIQPKTTPTVYFKTAFWGNGMDHMNINIGHLSEPFFNPGDELAVFDGNICVGALTLMPHHFRNQAVSIVVSSADEFGMPGFREGNPFSLKLWSSAQNKEFVLNPEIVKGTSTFVKNESTLISLEKYATTSTNNLMSLSETEINCFPNPFKKEVTIEFSLTQDTEVEGYIYNHLGQRTATLLHHQKMNSGTHRLTWEGKAQNGQRAVPGMYYVQLKFGEEIHHRKIVLQQ